MQFVHLIKSTVNNFGVQSSVVRNSCSNGNLDRSKSALAETDKIGVFSFVLNVKKTPEMIS